jgi:hypothetical protein
MNVDDVIDEEAEPWYFDESLVSLEGMSSPIPKRNKTKGLAHYDFIKNEWVYEEE